MAIDAIKIFGLLALSFGVAILWTPLLTHYLYAHKLWRKTVRDTAPDGTKTLLFAALHKDRETRVPRMGGLLIWMTTVAVALCLWLIAGVSQSPFWTKANFLSRNQTWLPLFTMLGAAALGMADDLAQIFGRGKYAAGGIRFRWRLAAIVLIGIVGGWWFHYKLGWQTIYVPGYGDMFINGWYVPLFVFTMVALFSTGVVDGIDGLAGGVFGAAFAAYGGIAFFRGQIDLAAFSAVVLGALLAFLWFNIPPARFYMGESGIMALTASLAVIAFLTDSVLALPIIGGVLFAESASVIVQFFSKRWRKKKVFLIAPIHHHFEARGWEPEKVTMRFWIVGMVCAIAGMALALIGR